MPRRKLRKRHSHAAFLKKRRQYYARHYQKHPEKLVRKREGSRIWHRENYRMRKRQKYESEHPCARCGHARIHTNVYGTGPCSHGRSIAEQLAAIQGEELSQEDLATRLRTIECLCPAHISALPEGVTLRVKRVRRRKGR